MPGNKNIVLCFLNKSTTPYPSVTSIKESLSHDKHTILKKADKFATIVAMNRKDYKREMNPQLHKL